VKIRDVREKLPPTQRYLRFSILHPQKQLLSPVLPFSPVLFNLLDVMPFALAKAVSADMVSY
jgi:hypothetical protein